MNKHNLLDWIVLALVLLAFGRGALELGEQSLWWDESLSHYRATQPFSFILSNQIYLKSGQRDIHTFDNHPPLYFVLLRLVVLSAGDSEFSLRTLSLFAGVLVVPLLYQCGRRSLDRRSGALAALLGALSPLYLWAQQEVRPYALGTLLATASFYALLRMVSFGQLSADPGTRLSMPARHRKSLPGRPRSLKGHSAGALIRFSWLKSVWAARWHVGYVLFTVAMLTTHLHCFLLLPAEGIILLLARSRRKRRVLAILAITAIVASGVLLWAWRLLPNQPKVAGFDFVPLGTLLEDVLRSFPLGVSGTTLVFFQWLSTGLLLASLAALVAFRRRTLRIRAAYLALCFLLPVGEVYVLSFVRPAYMNVRHLIFASPFYILLLAAGISQASRAWVRLPLTVALGGVLVGMLLSSAIYFLSPRYDKEDHRGWGQYLSQHIRPHDAVIVNPGPISELYLYYVENPAPWFGLPLWEYPDPEPTISLIDYLLHKYDRVWVAHSSTPGWANEGNIPLQWLEANAMRVSFANFRSPSTTVQAHAFRGRPPLVDTLPDSLSPLALDFDGQIHLLGVRSWSERGVAGHTLPVSLYWSATQSLDQAYRFTLSLSDDAGFVWALADYVPCGGAYPTTEWLKGRIVRDHADLELPFGVPPGAYRLSVSIYLADRSGPRLAVYDRESGALQGLIVPIAEIEVVAPEDPPSDREIAIMHETRHRYGEISLLGHSNSEGSQQPGDVILMDGYWRAIRAPRRDYGFALHLVDEEGAVRATRLVTPAEGYPTTLWSKGEVVHGQFRFRIPASAPEGQYTVCLATDQGRASRWQPILGGVWPCGLGGVALKRITVGSAADGRSFEIPPMGQSLRANIGDRAELLGYDLAADTVRPGETVSCTLYWRALQEMSQNYTVFNHLVAADGQTWGQWDNQPQRGKAPTTRWVPGQVIADPYEIPVSTDAPPGTLELRVGMYDLLTMQRLPVLGENGEIVGDHAVVTEIEVVDP